jgi:hypothetical protein
MTPGRRLRTMVGLVMLVHAIGAAAYFAADIEHAGQDARRWFFGAWIAVTLAVVLPQLRRMRMERDAARRRARR